MRMVVVHTKWAQGVSAQVCQQMSGMLDRGWCCSLPFFELEWGGLAASRASAAGVIILADCARQSKCVALHSLHLGSCPYMFPLAASAGLSEVV